jgi:plastocyanin
VAYDASNQVIANPGTPTFTSSAPTVAEVDGTGTVLAVSAGTAQVTVRLTFGGVSKAAEVPVTVIGALPNDANVVASSSDYVFTPATVVVHRGGSVTWNFGLLEHTVTFSGGTGSPTNITAGYSTSVSRTFATAGDYSYVCTIHSGMGGKVVVR